MWGRRKPRPGLEDVLIPLMLWVTRRKYLQHWRLEALLHRFQTSQQARVLAVTWQSWVHTQGVERLSWALVRGLGPSPLHPADAPGCITLLILSSA
jgi:hypothetical protein